MKRALRKPVYLLSAITLLIFCLVWSKIIFHPNTYLLSTGGDAFKNYYTPSWFVENDHGTHFTGMNYPYGENVVFTDNQPMLSWIINFIDNNIISVSGYTVGIINLLLFISLFFSVILLFRIMVHYGLPAGFAIICSILTGLMTPQLDRFWGHFALGYAVFIPLIWLLLIRIKQNNYDWKRVLLLSGIIVFFGFIHMYYVLLASLFLLFHMIVILFGKKRSVRSIISLAAAAFIPLLCILFFMKITDPIGDRPESPYGFFKYKATFQSVFLPMSGTIKNQASKLLHLSNANPEGFAYVGITGLLFLFILLFIFIKRWIFKRSFKNAFLNLPGDLGVFFAASVLMLLFSMTIPFNLGLKSLLEIISPLKQFRSPGRFAWGFYYVYMVSLSVIIYLLFKKIKKRHKFWAYAFVGVFFMLQAVDTWSYFGNTARRMQTNNAENPFVKSNTFFSDMFSGTKYKPEDFDAIVFVPSFFQGSEKLYIDQTHGAFSQAMEISWQTHLPLVNYMMSRTSFSQTLNNVQLVSSPYIENKSGEGVFNAKHLLLVRVDKPLKSGEQYLVDHSIKFSEKSGFTFYDLNMDSINDKGQSFAVKEYMSVKDSLRAYSFSGGEYFSTIPLQLFYCNHFNDQVVPHPFLGQGSFISEGEKKVMAEIPVSLNDTIWFEVSFWAKSSITSMAYPYINIDYFDGSGNWIKNNSVAPTLTIDVLRGWVRAAENFELLPSVKKLVITCSDDSEVNFDELLVRDTAASVYYDMVSPTAFTINNYPIGN